LLEGLREHGYIPGQNLRIECRWTERRRERASAIAAELVSLKPDLIIATTGMNTHAAKQATTEIPIVMFGPYDPVAEGLVSSLAHPGGNVTGLTGAVGEEVYGKRLQLLKEAFPTVSRRTGASSATSRWPGCYAGRWWGVNGRPDWGLVRI
jgi:putative ABC transport system substrate-binding protein